MSQASLSTGNGPGSSIALAPETIRVRNALIEKFSGAPLEDMNNFMSLALSNETDELRRLGILAARIYILRSRVANLKEFNRDLNLNSLPTLDTTTLSLKLPSSDESNMIEDGEDQSEPERWSRIQMSEPGEVNGVRFLAGTIIDAQTRDADKLINSGKAVRVDMDGDAVDHHEDEPVDSDNTTNANSETIQAVDNDASTSSASDDDTTSPIASDDAPTSDSPHESTDADAEAETSEGEAQTDDNSDENQKAPDS